MWGGATGARPGSIWGANSVRASDFWGREPAPPDPLGPPPRLFRNFRKSRNFHISPNFRELRDFGSFSPKRAAVSEIPGFGESDVGGRDWREAGPDLGGYRRESLGFLGSGTGPPDPLGPPRSPTII